MLLVDTLESFDSVTVKKLANHYGLSEARVRTILKKSGFKTNPQAKGNYYWHARIEREEVIKVENAIMESVKNSKSKKPIK